MSVKIGLPRAHLGLTHNGSRQVRCSGADGRPSEKKNRAHCNDRDKHFLFGATLPGRLGIASSASSQRPLDGSLLYSGNLPRGNLLYVPVAEGNRTPNPSCALWRIWCEFQDGPIYAAVPIGTRPCYRVIPTKAREENLSSLFTPSCFLTAAQNRRLDAESRLAQRPQREAWP